MTVAAGSKWDREVSRDEYVDAFETWGRLLDAHESEHYQKLGAAFASAWSEVRVDLYFDGLPERAPLTTYCKVLRAWERADNFKNYHTPLSIAVQKSNFLARRLYLGERFREHRCPIHDGHWDGQACTGIRPCPYACGGTGWLHAVPALIPGLTRESYLLQSKVRTK